MKLSVCIITKNEAANIARCLSSVTWADEIILLDESTDRTPDIAREYGATVITQPFLGYAKQKNKSFECAHGDWILSLDADEWLPAGAETIIREAISSKEHDAYYLRRKTHFLGTWIAHMGWYPDNQIRLFKKGATQFMDVPVHEKIEPTEHTAYLNLDISHDSYVSLEQYFEKNGKYTTLQAEQQRNKSFPLLRMLLYPPARFIQVYLFQLGVLDGWRGLQLACLRAWYDFTVHRKIVALQRTARQ